jgi:hypothetical protein
VGVGEVELAAGFWGRGCIRWGGGLAPGGALRLRIAETIEFTIISMSQSIAFDSCGHGH